MKRIELYCINGKYLIKADFSNNDFLIDGKRYLEVTSAWLPEKPKEAFVISTDSRAVSYGDLTPEQYNEKIKELRSHIVSSDDDYEKWDSLESEFAYKKFCSEHPAKWENYEKREPIEFIEIEITGRDDNKYIRPYRLIGKWPVKKDKGCLYAYFPTAYDMAVDLGLEYGIKDLDDSTMEHSFPKDGNLYFSVPNHSKKDLEFMKINGEFVHYPLKHSRYFMGLSAGTWEECEAAYKRDCDVIRGIFEKAIAERNRKSLATVGDLVKTLNRLEEIIESIMPSKGSSRQKINALNVIGEFKNNVLSGKGLKGE